MRKPVKMPLEELEPYLLTPPDPPAPIDWAVVFGNPQPVELEVGFGKGMFLLHQSEMNPDVNFVGVEIIRKYQLFTATRLAKRQRRNVRVVCDDARVFLRHCVTDASLTVVHVYFPDPWWKKRHHKRRVFTPEFAQEVYRILKPGGRLSFATDVQDYFTMVQEVIATMPVWEPLPPPEPGTPAHDLDYLTNFERKFRMQGKPIYRLALRKPPSDPAQPAQPANGIATT